MSFVDRITRHATAIPDRVAVSRILTSGGAEDTTWAQLQNMIGSASALLAEHDAAIVPIYSGRSAATVAVMVAAMRNGMRAATLNQKLKAGQIMDLLRVCGARFCVVDGPRLMSLWREAEQRSRLQDVTWFLVRDAALTAASEQRIRSMDGMDIRFLDFTEATAIRRADMPPSQASTDGSGACLFTSGSTGVPKGVLIDVADLVDRARAEIAVFGLTEQDRLLCLLPFSFDVGLNQLLTALWSGARLVVSDSWLPADILSAVERHAITGMSGVPSIWRDMLNAGLAFDTRRRHASLRYLTISGGSLSPRHQAQLPEMAPGVGILKTYGQTETFRSSCLLPDQVGARPDSVGRAFPGARIYIVDEDGQRCAPGEVGQVVHTGLGVMHGYLNGGTEDKKVPNPFYGPEDGSPAAILTGDFGFLDADGYLFLMGRRDDMVKVSGNRVYLAEVVAGMLKLETLALADVVPVKAEDDGETTLVAFVACKKPGGDGDVIRREVAKLLPSYMVPQHVILLDDFPHTESGKIDRVSLKVRAVDYVTSAAFRENAPSRGRPAE